MIYSAPVTNGVIDTTNIKTLLVQGESTHPQIVFSLDHSITGLTWYVRMTYLSFNLVVESDAITPTETESAVTVTWDVDASFTTLYGAAQLSLVGKDGETLIARAVGYVEVSRDWSGESMGTVTLNLFEQLLAQAAASIGHYAYIDETTGNWFNWNPSLGEFEDTGVHAQGIHGDKGDKGDKGDTGAGVASGGTVNQALVKASSTNYDTQWINVLSEEKTATLSSASWSGASAPYTQAITINGVTTTGKPPIIDVVLSDTYATAMNELTSYRLVYRFKVTANNTVTAYATAIPTTDINIHAKLVM